MCVIHDPLDQTHSPANSKHNFLFMCYVSRDFEKWGQTYVHVRK